MQLQFELPGETERGAATGNRKSNLTRPRVRGDLMEGTADLPKPRGLIEIIDQGELHADDRKLYLVLLAISWDRLADPRFPGPFEAPAADIRSAMGQTTQRGNSQLRGSMHRLRHTDVRFPMLVDGNENEVVCGLLSMQSVPRGRSGLVQWNFEPVLRPHLAEPGKWAWIHLRVASRLRSRYAGILYEMLAGWVNTQKRLWNVPIADLREFLGVEGKFADWGKLRSQVIEPALAEVNKHAPFTVRYESFRAAGQKRVERVVFQVTPKDDATLPGAGAIVRRG